MIGFPTVPEALTADWLSTVVGVRVHDLQIRPLGEGLGVIGWVNRVLLETANGPTSVIVKFASPAPENRAVAQAYDMYGREVHFYRALADRVPIRTPRCLAAEHDPATQDFVLVLEDLGALRMGDQLTGAGLTDATTVVRTLARLHAATWERPLPGVISHDFPAQRDSMAQGFRTGWPVVCQRFPELIDAAAARRAPALADHIGPLIERLTRERQSLIHADVRLDNVLFDDDDLVLVDWQSVCTCSSEQDLAYFLTQSLADPVREGHLDELISLYHRTLREHGVTGHDLGDCRERFRVATLYLLSWAVVIAGTLDMGNARGRALARTLLGRSLAAVATLRGFDLLP